MIVWFTPQIPTMTKPGPEQTQEPEFSRSPMCVMTQVLKPSPLVSTFTPSQNKVLKSQLEFKHIEKAQDFQTSVLTAKPRVLPQ